MTKLKGFADPIRNDSDRGRGSDMNSVQDSSARNGLKTTTTDNNSRSTNGSVALSYKAAVLDHTKTKATMGGMSDMNSVQDSSTCDELKVATATTTNNNSRSTNGSVALSYRAAVLDHTKTKATMGEMSDMNSVQDSSARNGLKVATATTTNSNNNSRSTNGSVALSYKVAVLDPTSKNMAKNGVSGTVPIENSSATATTNNNSRSTNGSMAFSHKAAALGADGMKISNMNSIATAKHNFVSNSYNSCHEIASKSSKNNQNYLIGGHCDENHFNINDQSATRPTIDGIDAITDNEANEGVEEVNGRFGYLNDMSKVEIATDNQVATSIEVTKAELDRKNNQFEVAFGVENKDSEDQSFFEYLKICSPDYKEISGYMKKQHDGEGNEKINDSSPEKDLGSSSCEGYECRLDSSGSGRLTVESKTDWCDGVDTVSINTTEIEQSSSNLIGGKDAGYSKGLAYVQGREKGYNVTNAETVIGYEVKPGKSDWSNNYMNIEAGEKNENIDVDISKEAFDVVKPEGGRSGDTTSFKLSEAYPELEDRIMNLASATEDSEKKMQVEASNAYGQMEWELALPDEDIDCLETKSMDDSDCFSFESINHDSEDAAVASAFDIKVLQKAIEASTGALDIVQGKDVVMIVGKTGVGKSTLIQGVAGQKIQKSMHEATFEGNTAVKQVFDVENAIAGFEIGHDSKSMTSHLSAFLRTDINGTETVYLDSPGMEDTCGVEMDIASSALFSEVAKRCKSLKFIVVIHCASLLEDRGGAFRSVLKFARKFVSDFKNSKKSFMFLFSHTNEIAEMLDSVENAKKRLQEEIIRTAGGTKEKDVLAVLQFIRESIKKSYPFADVYRPLELDFSLLTTQVEKKLKKLTDLTLASSCNLTTSSALKLESAVQGLVQKLRVALRQSSPDPTTAKEVCSTLNILDTYVKVSCVRKAVEESRLIMDEYMDSIKLCIEGHVVKGLDSNTEFSNENARLIKDYIMLVNELDPSFSLDQWHNTTKKQIIKFRHDTICGMFTESSFFISNTKKISTWANEFNEYSELYSELCTATMQQMQQMATKISDTDVTNIDRGSNHEITHFVTCFSQFYQFCHCVDQFQIKGIDAQRFLPVGNSTAKQLVNLLENWLSNTTKLKLHNLEKLIDGKWSLQPIARRTRAIEIIEDALKRDAILANVVKKAKMARRQIETHIVNWYASACHHLIDLGVNSRLEASIVWMHDTCRLFDDMNGDRWKQLQLLYSSLIDKTKAGVVTIAQQLVNKCDTMCHVGISDGKHLALELQQLRDLMWLDEWINSSYDSVSSYCRKFYDVISSRIKVATAQFDGLMKDLQPESSQICSSIEKIGCILPELREIDLFESYIRPPSERISISTKALACLNDFSASLHALGKEYTEQWVLCFHDGQHGYMCSVTEKLNCVLSQSQSLKNTAASNELVELVRACDVFISLVGAELKKCKEVINTKCLTFEGDFKKKMTLMTCIQACKHLNIIVTHLPDFDELRHNMRLLVSNEAQEIEEMIEKSSEWDIIDGRLRHFESALVLDSFVDEEVTRRLYNLQRMCEQKEGQVEELMTDMINERNFHKIGEFLSPLATSRDQLKRQKFEMYQNEIAMSLEDLIYKTMRFLEPNSSPEQHSENVSQNMRVLNSAKTELQKLLVPRLDLGKKLADLKKSINSVLSRFTDLVNASIKSNDLVGLVVSRSKANIFDQSVGEYFYKSTSKDLEATRERAKKAIAAVPEYLKVFFKSNFDQGKADQLAKVMHSLKESLKHQEKHFGVLHRLYDTTKREIDKRAHEVMNEAIEVLKEQHLYDDVIPTVRALNRNLQGCLKTHCSSELLNECNKCVSDLCKKKEEHDRWLCLDSDRYKEKIKEWSERMDVLDPNRRGWTLSRYIHFSFRSSRGSTYESYRRELFKIVQSKLERGNDALKSRDVQTIQECIVIIECVVKCAKNHMGTLSTELSKFRSDCIEVFCKICRQAEQMLQSDNPLQFEEVFFDYHAFATKVSCVLESNEGRKWFALVNQLLFETFEHKIALLRQTTSGEVVDFSILKLQVISTREFGNFLADNLTLLHEETKDSVPEKWLNKIAEYCHKYCSAGRNLRGIKYCALLGVPPSASKIDINKAFKEKAKKYHPDKITGSNDMFRALTEAKEKLLSAFHLSQTETDASRLFDDALIGIGEHLRRVSKKLMNEQQYDVVEKLLFQLPNMKVIADLVSPALECEEIILSVYHTVKDIVEKARIEVDSYWKARKYKELNDTISDLKLMEDRFSAYPQVFSSSWDAGITRKIETEIELLGEKGALCLESQVMARQKINEFRRILIEMGHVLVELPSFKAFTKCVMSDVLETSLDTEWGYGYLFELGLSLQKGDESYTDDQNRVAQMLITEFSHFKEVMTMVWNEETSRKPVDDVINGIKGDFRATSSSPNPVTLPIDIDKMGLLKSFHVYDQQYKSLLGDYLKPDADLNVLVHKTLAFAKQIKPSRSENDLNEHSREQIPHLLASVFALFTVLKSGASYNRIENAGGSSDLGAKLLMQPHSIQVLTLLYMFGCGSSNGSSLQSMLMQIRTGEGKSMILGAAAVMLSLLGFQVRTVCYSEYLSNRDFKLFEELFDRFGLTKFIKYSKITTFAEDSTSKKGDLRKLTECMLRGSLGLSNDIINPPGLVNSSLENVKLLDALDPPKSIPTDVNPTLICSTENSEHNDVKRVVKDKVLVDSLSESTCCKAMPETEFQLSSEQLKTGIDTRAKECPASSIPARPLINESTTNVAALSNHFQPKPACSIHSTLDDRREILLVDEVDVFFGAEFYGQTYNQVVEFREPDIAEILKRIWNAFNSGGRLLKLSDIQLMPEYSRLLSKLPDYLLDNEISLMLDQVRRVDDVPYYIHPETDRIGYKVMDYISYDVTYGYATIFAYLKEAGNLNKKDTLTNALVMPISCGQFSYANISPFRIIGVSGTLQALGDYEKEILAKYGLKRSIYVPSVYGASNFQFDKAGDGIYFEDTTSNFYHRLSVEIMSQVKSKRSVIVFFRDRSKLDEFASSPSYRQLGRNKKLLTEDTSSVDKEYIINKAATAGQITLCTSIFGRGTDFFCKDEVVEKSGGVHIIQTFLSEEISEEIQIQGRTARQGKQGTYQLILLESDLVSEFGVSAGEQSKVPKRNWYEWLCTIRSKHHDKQCKIVEANLQRALAADSATHKFFDSLLRRDTQQALTNFQSLYQTIKKPPYPSSLKLDIAFAIDVTGSMTPFAKCISTTVQSLIDGQNSIVEKLKTKFPEIEFKMRAAYLGYRDIDDKVDQFQESYFIDGCHFTEDKSQVITNIQGLLQHTFGGFDLYI